MDGWLGCLLVSFGQSFEMCIDSVEKSYEKKRRRRNTCDGLLFKCDHPEMVFSSSPTVCLISFFFFFCLFFVLARGAFENKKKERGA